ncbi:MAG: NUDIX hydrolase [bacterium]
MNERTLSTTTAFAGRLLNVEVLEVELEPGVRARREIVRHPGAAAVVARTPDGRFVFVRQFRKPLDREMLEIVAGGLEKGESPADCARREVKEESGHDVRALESLGRMAPAPGYTDEILHLFFAELAGGRGEQGGDHDERITVEYLTRDEVEEKLAEGSIQDGKTLAAWLLFTRRNAPPSSVQSSPAPR